jgi:hypothetical protein
MPQAALAIGAALVAIFGTIYDLKAGVVTSFMESLRRICNLRERGWAHCGPESRYSASTSDMRNRDMEIRQFGTGRSPARWPCDAISPPRRSPAPHHGRFRT